VYSVGNAKVWEPRAPTLGSNPAFGMIFQDNVNVTFLFPLQKHNNIILENVHQTKIVEIATTEFLEKDDHF